MLEFKVWIGVEKKHPHHCPRQVQSPPSSSYLRLLRTLLRMRRTTWLGTILICSPIMFLMILRTSLARLCQKSHQIVPGDIPTFVGRRKEARRWLCFLEGEEMARIPPFRASLPIWLPLPVAATHNHIYDDYDHTAAFQSL